MKKKKKVKLEQRGNLQAMKALTTYSSGKYSCTNI